MDPAPTATARPGLSCLSHLPGRFPGRVNAENGPAMLGDGQEKTASELRGSQQEPDREDFEEKNDCGGEEDEDATGDAGHGRGLR